MSLVCLLTTVLKVIDSTISNQIFTLLSLDSTSDSSRRSRLFSTDAAQLLNKEITQEVVEPDFKSNEKVLRSYTKIWNDVHLSKVSRSPNLIYSASPLGNSNKV